MLLRLLPLILVSAIALHAERDFLTTAEVDAVRLVQEPNERIVLYLTFAKQRIGMIRQAIAQEKPGRSKFVHDLLEDYTKIIEAIDTVSDDALRRKLNITEAAKAIASSNKEFAADLEKIRDSAPKDLARYEFVLDQAIDASRDSAELASQDLGTRSTEVQAKSAREQKEREESMKPADREAKQEAAKKETETKRKPPTLRRKGEVVKEP